VNERSAALDACRGAAVLAVIVLHLGHFGVFPPLPGAWRNVPDMGMFGVDLFYVLSGFFITQAILRPATWDPRRFLMARVTRIYPAYLVALFLSVAAILYTRGIDAALVVKVMLHLLMLHNFMPGANSAINGVFWTLGVEFPYYVLMLAIAPFLRERQAFWFISLTMLAVSVLWRTGAFLWVGAEGRYFVATQLPGAIDAFAVGGIAAALHLRPDLHRLLAQWRWAVLGAGLAALALCLAYFYRHSGDYWRDPASAMLWRSGFAIASAVIVLACAKMHDSPALARTSLPWIGKISFSLYLFHMPAIELTKRYPVASGWPYDLAEALVIMFVASWLCWRFVEIRFHRPSAPVAAAPAAATAPAAAATPAG